MEVDFRGSMLPAQAGVILAWTLDDVIMNDAPRAGGGDPPCLFNDGYGGCD